MSCPNKCTRQRMPNVVALHTAKLVIQLAPGQWFYRTGASWKIAEKAGPGIELCVKTIPRKRVLFVEELNHPPKERP